MFNRGKAKDRTAANALGRRINSCEIGVVPLYYS